MRNYLNYNIKNFLIRQFLDYWWMYLLGIGCLFGTHYLQSYIPEYAKDFGERIASGNVKVDTGTFLWLALGIVFFRTSSRLLFFTPARYMERNMRDQLMCSLESASPYRYNQHSRGQIYQVAYSDVMNMRGLVGFGILQMGNIVVALSILIPKMYSFNPSLVVGFTPMFLCVVLFIFITSRYQKYFKLMQDYQGEVQNFLIESYQGKKTIKNFQSEKSFLDLFNIHCEAEFGAFLKATKGPILSIPLIAVGVGLSFIWGALIISKQDLGAGSLIFYSGFVFLMLEPLMYISWMGMVVARSLGSWHRLKDLNHSLETISKEEVKLKGLNEGRKVDSAVLPLWKNNIAYEIKPSKWNVLVGQTGHGKTHLLTLYAQHLVDRNEKISFVAQEPYLYNDSIKNNIFLGNDYNETELKRAKELLTLFGLDEIDKNIDYLLELEVGENGKRLSGGQAKRVAVIRSILSNADYIFWDDPFSSIDFLTEKDIVEKLQMDTALVDKTIILTSHRLTTLKACHEVAFIDKEAGLVESGEVDKLLNSKSRVYEYFQDQFI